MTDRASRSHLLPARPRPALIAVWGVMAALNLAAGVVIASWPDRQADLETMTQWGRNWLLLGLHVYGPAEEDPADYPPHAIVMLSLLALLPDAWRVPLWAGLNLALVIGAAWLAVRTVRPDIGRMESALPVLILLCWGGLRALLQFSLLAFVFGLLAVVLADRRPVWSGLCLGMGLMKPQMTAPIFLWALFTRRFRLAGIAIAPIALGFGLVCARTGMTPDALAKDYLATLAGLYMGDATMIGLAELRPLIRLTTSNHAVVDLVASILALALLAVVCALGLKEGRTTRTLLYSAPGLAALWSLMTFYHLTYGFILLLPLGALLLFDDNPQTFFFRRRVFWAMQAALMFDVPGLWWRFGHLVSAPPFVSDLTIHVDRFVMVGLFVCVAVLAVRRQGSGVAARAD